MYVYQVKFTETLKHSNSDETDIIENDANVTATDAEHAIEKVKKESKNEYEHEVDGVNVVSKIEKLQIIDVSLICSIDY